jgi:tetratricopeptide (TPR) repeat protein
MSLRKIAIRIVTLLLAALILAGCGAEGRKAKYLERGKNYINEEKYDKAAVELKNVLQIDPKHAEAYFLIARIEEERRNYERAFGYYNKAVELNPDYLEARAKLALFYLLSGNIAKASEMTEALLAKNPANLDARLLKAAIMSKQGNDRGAIQVATEIVSVQPGYRDAVDFLVAIYVKQGKTDAAVDILEKGLAANPKSTPMRMQLAQLYSSKNERDKAERLLREVVVTEPGKLQNQAALASFLSQTNQLDKAEAVLREAIQNDPEDPQRHLLLAELLASRVDVKKAETELLASIKSLPDNNELRFALGLLYEQLNMPDKAAAAYREIISSEGKKPDGLKARNKLANTLLVQNQSAEADKVINKVLKENPRDSDALTLQGKAALKKGDGLTAINSLRAVLKDQPTSPEILGLLADAYVLNNDPELARESLKKGVEANPNNVSARLRLAQFLARTNDYTGALMELDKVLAIAPNDVTALQAKAEVQAVKRDYKGAEYTVGQIKAGQPANPLGYLRMGQLYVAQKKYDLALLEYEQALKISHNPTEPLTAIVNACLAQGKPDKAINRLNDANKDKPDQAITHELLGEVYLSQKHYAEAEKSLRKASEINSKWNAPHLGLAKLRGVQGDMPGAIKFLETGLQAIPDDTQLLLTLASTQQANRDYTGAIATYERLLKINPGNDLAANNLASLLADDKGDTSSLKRARELAARFETSRQPAFVDTLGWVNYKSGNSDKALTLFKKATDMAPQVPVFQYHLGMVYHSKGDNQSAKVWLAKALGSKRDFPGSQEASETLMAIQ